MKFTVNSGFFLEPKHSIIPDNTEKITSVPAETRTPGWEWSSTVNMLDKEQNSRAYLRIVILENWPWNSSLSISTSKNSLIFQLSSCWPYPTCTWLCTEVTKEAYSWQLSDSISAHIHTLHHLLHHISLLLMFIWCSWRLKFLPTHTADLLNIGCSTYLCVFKWELEKNICKSRWKSQLKNQKRC